MTPVAWYRKRKYERAIAAYDHRFFQEILGSQCECDHRPLDCCSICGLPVVRQFNATIDLPVRCKAHVRAAA